MDLSPFVKVPYKGPIYTDGKLVWGGSSTDRKGQQFCVMDSSGKTTVYNVGGGNAVASGSSPFTDVPAGSYYEDAVLWAYQNGITSGTTATAFSPNNTCTNGHVVTFLWRSNGEPAAAGTSSLANQFPNNYYTAAVAWADTTGLLEGTGSAFNPNSMSPRSNIVTYLYRNMTK